MKIYLDRSPIAKVQAPGTGYEAREISIVVDSNTQIDITQEKDGKIVVRGVSFGGRRRGTLVVSPWVATVVKIGVE